MELVGRRLSSEFAAAAVSSSLNESATEEKLTPMTPAVPLSTNRMASLVESDSDSDDALLGAGEADDALADDALENDILDYDETY